MSAPTAPATVWFAGAAHRPGARMRVVCLPHAGGSAAMFRDWQTQLDDAAVLAVRYPGRAERIAEPLPDDLPALAAGIAGALAGLTDLPLVLFGHSMGAAVALETARCLERDGATVAHLIASGSREAPLPEPQETPGEQDDDPAVLARLIMLGGTDPELAADPYFQELVLPYIRGDGEMFHAYMRGFRLGPPLRCPVTAIAGDDDADADLRPWSRLTTGAFRQRAVPGDHFYLTDDPPFDTVRAVPAAGGETP